MAVIFADRSHAGANQGRVRCACVDAGFNARFDGGWLRVRLITPRALCRGLRRTATRALCSAALSVSWCGGLFKRQGNNRVVIRLAVVRQKLRSTTSWLPIRATAATAASSSASVLQPCGIGGPTAASRGLRPCDTGRHGARCRHGGSPVAQPRLRPDIDRGRDALVAGQWEPAFPEDAIAVGRALTPGSERLDQVQPFASDPQPCFFKRGSSSRRRRRHQTVRTKPCIFPALLTVPNPEHGDGVVALVQGQRRRPPACGRGRLWADPFPDSRG